MENLLRIDEAAEALADVFDAWPTPADPLVDLVRPAIARDVAWHAEPDRIARMSALAQAALVRSYLFRAITLAHETAIARLWREAGAPAARTHVGRDSRKRSLASATARWRGEGGRSTAGRGDFVEILDRFRRLRNALAHASDSVEGPAGQSPAPEDTFAGGHASPTERSHSNTLHCAIEMISTHPSH